MNSQKEKWFVNVYINKRYKERLNFEFSSQKKRQNALERFAHNTESIIDDKKLSLKTDALTKSFFIKLFINTKSVYVISDKYLDGTEMNIEDAYNYLINEYSTVLLCADSCAVIKSECEDTSHYFVLKE